MKTALADPHDMPEPECKYGYPQSQIEKIFPEDRLKEFHLFMNGQTVSLCNNRRWDYILGEEVEDDCGTSHGTVFYRSDVFDFLSGRPVTD